MEKTRMPAVAGILDIISGVLGIPFVGLLWLLWSTLHHPVVGVSQGEFLSFIWMPIIIGILAIVGGIFALSRQKWGLALAGSIAASFLLLLPGIAAIVLTALSKKEF